MLSKSKSHVTSVIQYSHYQGSHLIECIKVSTPRTVKPQNRSKLLNLKCKHNGE